MVPCLVFLDHTFFIPMPSMLAFVGVSTDRVPCVHRHYSVFLHSAYTYMMYWRLPNPFNTQRVNNLIIHFGELLTVENF